MIDINTYRSRIGLFSPKVRENKFLLKGEYYKKLIWNENNSGKFVLSALQFTFKMLLLLGLFQHHSLENESCLSTSGHGYSRLVKGNNASTSMGVVGYIAWVGTGARGAQHIIWKENYEIEIGIIDHNFQARYTNGNIQKKKGILNMHLNIRSLKNKVYEVKHLVKQHNPHILGLSECELNRNNIDEKF